MKKYYELVLVRIAKMENYTIGRLYVKYDKPVVKCVDGEIVTEDKHYLCDTLEPRRRNLKKEKKVLGRTAIPEGRYRIVITKSFRFKCWLPQVREVPGFSGIRFHAGNYPSDTRGCILPGWNRKKGMVVNSRAALQMLMQEMTAALDRDEQIWLTIM